jgi:hypothetical protein
MQLSYKRQAIREYEMCGKLTTLVTLCAAFDENWKDNEMSKIWRKAGNNWLAQNGRDNH